jgi:hypothetical protein
MTAMSDLFIPHVLTDRQIAWCRQNIKSFSEAWQNAQKADAHRLEVYKKLGVEPGALPRRLSPAGRH